MLVDYIHELIAPNEVIPLEVTLVHIPELDTSDTGIRLPDILDVLQCKGSLGGPAQRNIFIPLIIF